MSDKELKNLKKRSEREVHRLNYRFLKGLGYLRIQALEKPKTPDPRFVAPLDPEGVAKIVDRIAFFSRERLEIVGLEEK
jgi:hypothetical protein